MVKLNLRRPLSWPVPIRFCILLVLLFVSSPGLPAPSSAAANPSVASLSRGSHISVENRNSELLLSPDGTFSCGFHHVGTNAFSFSIWYTAGTPATVVWSANRDRPVNGRRSRLTLDKNGLLVLTDGTDDSVVWRSNGTAAGHTAADRAELLDTGNLVLRGPGRTVYWQSFDFPTDTLLPGQPFTKNVRLVSSARTGSLASGYFVLYFDNDNVLRLMYDGPDISSIYWPNPDYRVWENMRTSYNSTRYAMLDSAGRFISTDNMTFTVVDYNIPPEHVRRRLTLDPDGNLRVYSRLVVQNSSSISSPDKGGWYISWQARNYEISKTHGLCGRNGVVVYNLHPRCSCPVGYEMANPASWKDGCKPMFDPSTLCRKDLRPLQYLSIPHTDFYGSDINFTTTLSFDACKGICDADCSCQGFVYRQTGQGNCYPKALLFNGYTDPLYPATVYVKLPRDFKINVSTNSSSHALYPNLTIHELDCTRTNATNSPSAYNPRASFFTPTAGFESGNGGGWRKGGFKWAYGYSFAAAFGFVEFLFIFTGWWFLYRGRGPSSAIMPDKLGYEAISSQFRKFWYVELKKATNNFKQKLGSGGSGDVYKGVLEDKRVVAVKRLTDIQGQGDAEFRAELSMIGKINHMNLVRMWGFCLEPSRRLLVYEFIENGSLAKALFHDERSSSRNLSRSRRRTPVLDWEKRFNIAVGTARGLAYLHHECLEWIIHCDIKPENILLDSDYQPKIADFGLVKLTQRGGPGSHLTNIRGTKGYMAPEWTSNVPITAKVDVYSYGVILLELVRGVRLSSWDSLHSDQSEDSRLDVRGLVSLIKERLADSSESGFQVADQFVDPRLVGKFDVDQVMLLLEIAVSCLQEDRNKRPTMDSVVLALLK